MVLLDAGVAWMKEIDRECGPIAVRAWKPGVLGMINAVRAASAGSLPTAVSPDDHAKAVAREALLLVAMGQASEHMLTAINRLTHIGETWHSANLTMSRSVLCDAIADTAPAAARMVEELEALRKVIVAYDAMRAAKRAMAKASGEWSKASNAALPKRLRGRRWETLTPEEQAETISLVPDVPTGSFRAVTDAVEAFADVVEKARGQQLDSVAKALP
jgi:hypothetical protein